MRITDEINDRGIFPSPSFDDVSRKMNAENYFVAEKNKVDQSKTSGTGSSGIC